MHDLIYYIWFFSSLFFIYNLPALWNSARENVLTVWGVSFQTMQFVVQTELCILACSRCLNTDWTVAVWACKAVSLHEGQPQWFWGWGLTTKWGRCRREKGRDGEHQECCWLGKKVVFSKHGGIWVKVTGWFNISNHYEENMRLLTLKRLLSLSCLSTIRATEEKSGKFARNNSENIIISSRQLIALHISLVCTMPTLDDLITWGFSTGFSNKEILVILAVNHPLYHKLGLFRRKQHTDLDEVIVFVYQELQHNGHLPL